MTPAGVVDGGEYRQARTPVQELRIWLTSGSWRTRWWAVENWWKGYRFGSIQRCRFCDHTTPYHYSTCRLKVLPEDTVTGP